MMEEKGHIQTDQCGKSRRECIKATTEATAENHSGVFSYYIIGLLLVLWTWMIPPKEH